MTDTPIIDAAIRAGCASQVCTYPDFCCDAHMPNTCIHRVQFALRALRAANPWTPPPEEIEAMWKAYVPEYDSQGVSFEADWKSSIIAGMFRVYRARLIMRELYDSDGAPR